jgi:NADH:ubiquinone oxidoreductase subunit 4 (subunit M)
MNLTTLILLPLLTAVMILLARNESQVKLAALAGSALQLGLAVFLFICSNAKGYQEMRRPYSSTSSTIGFPR